MNVRVEITRKDLIRLNLAMLPKLCATYRMIFIVGVATLAFIVVFHGPVAGLNGWLIAIGCSIIGGIASVFVSVVINFISIWFTSEATEGVLGQHEYEISDVGLWERTPVNEGLSRWQGVTDIAIYGSFLTIGISGNYFHIFPARCFKSTEEFHLFASKAKELRDGQASV